MYGFDRLREKRRALPIGRNKGTQLFLLTWNRRSLGSTLARHDWGLHGDASAALVVDGQLVVAVEEERFNRIKRSAGFPAQAIRKPRVRC